MASYSAILGFERPSHRNFRTSISRGVKESKASSAFLQSSDWLDYIWAYDGDDIIDGGDGNDAIAGVKVTITQSAARTTTLYTAA